MVRLLSCGLVTLLLLAGSASAQSVVTYGRIVRHAVVLEQPRGDSAVVTTIPPGVVVELVALRGDWYQTSLQFDANGLGRPFGWIQRQTVELLPAQAQEQLSTAREVAPQQARALASETPAPERVSSAAASPTSQPSARFPHRLRFYPSLTSGFFITGGLGLGHVSDGYDTEWGPGAVVGLGWDVRVGRNVSLTPFWNGFAMSSELVDRNVGQLGLGVTIH